MSQIGVAFAGSAPAIINDVSRVLATEPTVTEHEAWTVAHFDTGVSTPQLDEARTLVQAVDGSFLVIPDGLTDGPGLLVSDVDSTLITAEVIELIAEHAGTRELVADITERAMRGELDFAASLTERVGTLAGVADTVFADVRRKVEFSPGAADLAERLKAAGWTFCLVSGGFREVVASLAADLGITRFAANELEVANGQLTGRVVGDIVTGTTKAQKLRQWAHELDVPMSRTIAVGDGANDLAMMEAAAVGVAYCAKPVVAAQASVTVNFPRLDVIAALLRI